MKLTVFCATCLSSSTQVFVQLPLRDDNLYSFVCPSGHAHVVYTQMFRFQLLAEVAVQAVADGYYRDATSSFAACLERFMEIYSQVIALTRDINVDAFEATWKVVKKQSERQLGLFAAMHLIENGGPPPMLTNAKVEFRNRVIHQGYLPTEGEAMAFGESVITLIRPLLQQISGAKYRTAITTLMLAMNDALPNKGQSITMNYGAGNILLMGVETNSPDLQVWIERRRDTTLKDMGLIHPTGIARDG